MKIKITLFFLCFICFQGFGQNILDRIADTIANHFYNSNDIIHEFNWQYGYDFNINIYNSSITAFPSTDKCASSVAEDLKEIIFQHLMSVGSEKYNKTWIHYINNRIPGADDYSFKASFYINRKDHEIRIYPSLSGNKFQEQTFGEAVYIFNLTIKDEEFLFKYKGCDEENEWQVARYNIKTIAAFLKYIQDYPNGVHVSEARGYIETLRPSEAFTLANSIHTICSYESFMSNYPLSPNFDDAKKAKENLINIDGTEWDKTNIKKTKEAYQDYIKKDSCGMHIEDAKEAINGFDYRALIAKADSLFNFKKYDEAKTEYQKAVVVKPKEKYPKDKIAECEKELTYLATINKADYLFSTYYYGQAKMCYEGALKIKPNEQYPKDKIAEIDKIDKSYDDAITKADYLYNSKKYKDAKTEYQNALGIKPNEQYPKEQIIKCDDELAYIAAIAEGDKYYTSKEYDDAETTYQKASKIKPNEQYPKDKIAECIKELKYIEIINKADDSFKKYFYEDAKKWYEGALIIKPSEKYPQDQIDKIKEIDKSYNDAIAEADKHYKNKKYEKAKIEYQGASKIKPNEQYPKEQIIAIEKELKYISAIAKGDTYFDKKNYDEAKKSYLESLDNKKDDQYANDQIEKINIINEAYLKSEAEADKQFDKKNYDYAKTLYKKIIDGMPYKQDPKDKLDKIEEFEKKYNNYINEGENEYKNKEYQKAKTAYQNASKIKPNEQYPKTKINDCEKGITDESYNDAIAEADEHFKKDNLEEYTKAKAAYQKASEIKPKEQYPKDQIIACDKMIIVVEPSQTTTNLKVIIDRHLSGDNTNCPYCGYYKIYPANSIISGEWYKCMSCGNYWICPGGQTKTLDKNSLKVIIDRHLSGDNTYCPYCGYYKIYPANSIIASEWYKCMSCGNYWVCPGGQTKTLDKNSLKVIIDRHLSGDNTYCPYCGYYKIYPANSIISGEWYKCMSCGNYWICPGGQTKTLDKNSLKVIIDRHLSGDNTYCPYCGYYKIYPANSIISGEKYKCQSCFSLWVCP